MKRLMYWMVSILLLGSMTFAGCGNSASVRDPKNIAKYTFKQLGEDVMPIGGYIGPPPADPFPGNTWSDECPDYITEEQYQYIEDSGVNVIYGLKEDYATFSQSTMTALNLAQQHGIVYIASDSRLYDIEKGIVPSNQEFDEKTASYRNHPAFGGIYLKDEPGAKLFETIADIKEVFDDWKVGYNINLLPTYAQPEQLSGESNVSMTYEEYLSQYMEIVQPAFISYDYYPCMGTFPELMGGYYENMRIVRKYAQEYGVPYWTFIQCGGPWEKNEQVRYPSEAELLWQVNSGLAFGAKGIQYFPYFFPPEWTQPGHEDTVAGLIGRDGKPSPLYTYAQKANAQIAAIDEVLMNSYNDGIMMRGMGGTPMNPGQGEEKILLSEYYELKSIDKESVDCIVGCFNHQGKSVFYVVNNTIDEDGTVILHFDKKYGMEITQNAEKHSVTEQDLTLTLTAGEGALVVLK